MVELILKVALYFFLFVGVIIVDVVIALSASSRHGLKSGLMDGVSFAILDFVLVIVFVISAGTAIPDTRSGPTGADVKSRK